MGEAGRRTWHAGLLGGGSTMGVYLVPATLVTGCGISTQTQYAGAAMGCLTLGQLGNPPAQL